MVVREAAGDLLEEVGCVDRGGSGVGGRRVEGDEEVVDD